MHGRVKTKTTEEQREILRREKLKKATAFKETMTVILAKRSTDNHDEEGLKLTASLLTENPDIITLWNYRREILMGLRKEDDTEGRQKLLEKDLNLTEQCLRVNPKSYGSWHHRIWILDNLPEPDWSREMKLCTKYLQLDERNFHCWDYRRTIAERSKVPDVSEYEFTLEKIEANFSNYSAWHLRSKLLPRIFPDPKKRFPIDGNKHREELELVENAAFTDPNDQSAWFYLRWLLGLTEPKTHFLRLTREKNDVVAVTSNSIRESSECQNSNFGFRLVVEINGQPAKGTWTSACLRPQSSIWTFKSDSEVQPEDVVSVSLLERGTECDRQDVPLSGFVADNLKFLPEFSPDLRETMTNQLASCNQLVDLEPESKWTLLTRIFLMVCLDARDHEDEIKNGLDDLSVIDPLRCGYYRDLRSRLTMELAIGRTDWDRKRFQAAGQHLTSVYHSQYLWTCEEIDLSQNYLSSESLGQFYPFAHCKRLTLDGNKIEDLSKLPGLPRLEILSVASNSIVEFDFDLLTRCPRLQRVDLTDNPIASTIDLTRYAGKVRFDLSTSPSTD